MLNCILIVDDDNVSNYLTEKVLKSYGEVRMVTAVTDGKQAVNYLKHQCFGNDIYACPDLILLDLNMPYYDGMELLNNSENLGLDKNIPIVVLTSEEPTPELKNELARMEVNYIIKPLTADKFSEIFAKVILNS